MSPNVVVHSLVRPVVALATVLALQCLAAPPARADLLSEEWTLVRSPSFAIMSRVSERKTRELALDLERFRKVAIALSNVQSVSATIPTRIYVIEQIGEWREVGADPSLAGFFRPLLRHNLMVIRATEGGVDTDYVQHEYVHYLQNRSQSRYPLWYSEGFAEFLSTVKTRVNNVDVGRAPPHRIQWLDNGTWVPIRKIIEPEAYHDWPDDEKAMFYAESWALVHYLVAGGDYPDSFTRRLNEYLKAVDSGVGGQKAFETAFDVRLKSLDRTIKQYVKRGRYRGFALPAEKFEPEGEIEARTLPPLEAAIAVGTLLLDVGQYEAAQRAFLRAVEIDGQNARARAGLGRALMGTVSGGALAQLDEAIGLAADDAQAHLDRAWFLLQRGEQATDPVARAADVAEARKNLTVAWQQDKSAPETYALYGRSYLLAGDNVPRAIEMLEEAQRLLPTDLSIRVMLADAYLAAGRRDDAEQAARSVLAWSHRDTPDARRAREILDVLSAGAPAPPDAPATSKGPDAMVR